MCVKIYVSVNVCMWVCVPACVEVRLNGRSILCHNA